MKDWPKGCFALCGRPMHPAGFRDELRKIKAGFGIVVVGMKNIFINEY
jgi:hypothetical protein